MGADDKSGSTGTNYKNTDGGPEGIRQKTSAVGTDDTEGQSKSMAVGPDEFRTMSTETEPEDTEGQSKSMAVGPDEFRTVSKAKSDEPSGPTEATPKQL
jgi:hypothetical protein